MPRCRIRRLHRRRLPSLGLGIQAFVAPLGVNVHEVDFRVYRSAVFPEPRNERVYHAHLISAHA